VKSIAASTLNRAQRIAFVVAMGFAALLGAVQPAAAQKDVAVFDLYPNSAFVSCLAVPGKTPKAQVTVTRGKFADTLVIKAQNIKPNLAFDMFTVERSSLLSNGTADPNFTNFGMAWYQSDLQANNQGVINTSIKTILLDQIFGFDADLSNPNPINAFHVGFWFNNPNDANTDGCTFDVTKPTPFNGEHQAGPVAMISVPDYKTNLGPLCTNPNLDTDPVSCNP